MSASNERHGFTITIEVVQPGPFTDGLASTLELARKIDGEMLDEAHVLVEETGEHTFRTIPNGVFCEGCEGCTIPGVRWPTATNSDDSHDWIERCDTCELYGTDEDAYQRVLDEYGPETIASDFEHGYAKVAGVSGTCPYVDMKHVKEGPCPSTP